MEQEPLIWTSKGNLPISSLAYEPSWDIVPGQYIKFVERYRLDGEVVKESAHVYSMQGVSSAVEAGQVGG